MKVIWKLTTTFAMIAISAMSVASAQAQSSPYAGASYRYFDDGAAPAPVAESHMGSVYSVGDMGCESGCATGCSDGCTGCGSCGTTSCCSSSGFDFGSIFGCCSLGEPVKLFGFPCNDIDVAGWTQVGYHNRSTGIFNDRPDKFNLHQQYMYIEKVADGSDCCWDWGFRTDVLYGIDGPNTQAFGNPQNGPGTDARRWDNPLDHGIGNTGYGWAIPQAYLEMARGDLSVKAGHFYTLAGYETVTAPDNFFYSHAMTMNFSEPFTHTGVLGTYSLNDCTEIYAGWTLGWDTGFDRFGQANNAVAGISRSISDETTLTWISFIGDMGQRGEGYNHSIVLSHDLSDNLHYVFQSDWVSFNKNNPTGNLNDTIGVNQYLTYDLSDCLAVGSRVEWWKADGQSLYSATSGLNYRPHANIVLRPEVRYNWGAQAFGIPSDQWIFGVDAIVTY